MKDRPSWLKIAALALLTLAFVWLLEARRPYYFLQDDNRTVALPSLAHITGTLASDGSVQQYNFHQFLGYPVFQCGAALYPPVYISVWLSKFLLGHIFGAMDILVALHLLAAALGAFFLLSFLRLKEPAPLFGGLAWALCPFVVYTGASWWVASLAAAYFPLMLLAALKLLRTPGLTSALWLAVVHALFIYAGYPQYFVYALALELLVVLFCLFKLKSAVCAEQTRRPGEWKPALYCYLASGAAAVALALPYLLPVAASLSESADRGEAFGFAEFSIHNFPVLGWAQGLLFPVSSPASTHLLGPLALPELAHLGYVLPLLALLAFYLLFRKKGAAPEYKILFAAGFWGWLFCWLWAIGAFNPFEYLLPLLNRFRWHFKILLFADFFAVLAAAAALSWLAERKPRLAWALAAAQALNMVVLYVWGPAPVFSLHTDAPPLSEPLSGRLREGRIFTAGFNSLDRESVRTLGYNYATLFRLFHFAGYDVLLPEANQKELKGLKRDSSVPKPPNADFLGRLRKWGVRWYVFPSPLPDSFARFARKENLVLLKNETGRAIFEDRAALPLAWRMEKGEVRALENRVSGNSWTVATEDKGFGCLTINTLYNPGFRASPSGASVAMLDGQVEVCYPAGSLVIELRYVNPWLWLGAWLAALSLAVFGVVLLLRRNRARSASGKL